MGVIPADPSGSEPSCQDVREWIPSDTAVPSCDPNHNYVVTAEASTLGIFKNRPFTMAGAGGMDGIGGRGKKPVNSGGWALFSL